MENALYFPWADKIACMKETLRIRVKYASYGSGAQKSSSQIHHHVTEKGVRTGKLDYLFEITEKVGDFQDCAEGQWQYQ